MTATTMGSNNDGLPPREPTGEAMTQSGIDVVQELYRVSLANHEDTIASRHARYRVGDPRRLSPRRHLRRDTGNFRPVLPKLQADFHDWHVQPDEFVDAGDTIVALGHYSRTSQIICLGTMTLGEDWGLECQ